MVYFKRAEFWHRTGSKRGSWVGIWTTRRCSTKKRLSTPRKIDPYCGIIHSRLEAFPELSAERVYRELRAAGYEGGYTQVKEYVRKERPRPVPKTRPF